MLIYPEAYEPFCDSFLHQLQALSQTHAFEFSFLLKLPSNRRFHYTKYHYIHKELSKALQIRYPLGFKIIRLLPDENDDHFIQVTIRI